jgi:hypothetical protein
MYVCKLLYVLEDKIAIFFLPFFVENIQKILTTTPGQSSSSSRGRSGGPSHRPALTSMVKLVNVHNDDNDENAAVVSLSQEVKNHVCDFMQLHFGKKRFRIDFRCRVLDFEKIMDKIS